MAKNSYPEELLALLQTCLTDGAISAKEREVLLKKAEKLGVDPDEFDLYIDAEQQKIDQTAQAAANKLRGRACPYCGGAIQQLTDKCPHCGKTLSADADDEVKSIIDALEIALVDLKSGKDIERSKAQVERYIRKAQLYYNNNPKINDLVAKVSKEMESTIIETERLSQIQEQKHRSKERLNIVASVFNWNKKLTTLIILALLVFLILGIRAIFSGPDYSDPQFVITKMNEAIDNGEYDKADEYISMYMSTFSEFWGASSEDESNAEDMYRQLIIKTLDADSTSKAMNFLKKMDENTEYNYSLHRLLAHKLIEKGEYDDAITAMGYGFSTSQAEEVLIECVSDMVKKGENDKARRFIMAHYDWYQFIDEDALKFKNRLLDMLK
jgi:hypothetical protein